MDKLNHTKLFLGKLIDKYHQLGLTKKSIHDNSEINEIIDLFIKDNFSDLKYEEKNRIKNAAIEDVLNKHEIARSNTFNLLQNGVREVVVKEQKEKVDKSMKRIREVGIFAQILGWGKIVFPFVIPFLIVEDEILKIFLSYSYSDIAWNICLGIIFIILGNRIHKGPDKNTKKYLWIILLLSGLSGTIHLLLGGSKYSFILGLFAVSVYALVVLKNVNIPKNEPQYKIHGGKWGWIVSLVVLVLMTGFLIDVATYEEDALSEQNQISVQNNIYINTVHGFTIEFPKGWEIGPPTRPSETIVQRAVNSSKNISVMVIDLDTTKKSVKDFGTAKNKANEVVDNAKLGGVSNVKLIDYGETMISERPAYWVIFSGYHSDTGVEYTSIVYSIIKDGNLFNISSLSTPQEFPTYLPTFQKVSKSFTFKN